MLRRCAVVAVALLVVLPVATIRSAGDRWTPDLMLKTKRVSSVIPSPDGSRVAFVVAEAVMEAEKSEWISQIHVAASDGSGSYQLTRGDKSATAPRWTRDGSSIAFLSPRANDKANIFLIRAGGGEAEQITEEKASITAFELSPDGRHAAFLMPDPKAQEESEKAEKEKRDAKVIDEDDKLAGLHIVPLAKDSAGKRTVKKLKTGNVHVTAIDWSPDSSSIVFAHARTSKVFDQSDISTIKIDGGEARTLVATKADEMDAFYSRDGRSIGYVVTDDPPTWGFTGWARVIPAAGGEARKLAPTFDEQPNILGWSADGKALIVSETEGTIGRIYSLPADGGPATALGTTEVNITASALNASGTAVGFVHMWSDKAPEPYASPLSTFAAKQVATVQTLPPPKEAPIGRTEALRWKARDGLEVEGLLTYPVGYEKGRRVPLLVVVHGGPTGVFTRSFLGLPGPYPVPIFGERGYAVLRVNPRGSSGYGRKFRYANYKDWGGGDYNDIMSGVDHTIAMGVADADRLGIMGWSYGGYMTSWVITQTKRFKAASVGAGVTNLMSFTGTADIPGFIPDYMGGEYWDVFDQWRARSAMFHVKGVSTPTLIQHGDRDLRVPISQGYELYNALVRQNVPTKMVVYPRQPHGIQEPKLMKDSMERNVEWFDRWIKRGSGPGTRESGSADGHGSRPRD